MRIQSSSESSTGSGPEGASGRGPWGPGWKIRREQQPRPQPGPPKSQQKTTGYPPQKQEHRAAGLVTPPRAGGRLRKAQLSDRPQSSETPLPRTTSRNRLPTPARPPSRKGAGTSLTKTEKTTDTASLMRERPSPLTPWPTAGPLPEPYPCWPSLVHVMARH